MTLEAEPVSPGEALSGKLSGKLSGQGLAGSTHDSFIRYPLSSYCTICLKKDTFSWADGLLTSGFFNYGDDLIF